MSVSQHRAYKTALMTHFRHQRASQFCSVVDFDWLDVVHAILLSEGSGLTSRQVAGQLSSLGHEVEILSSSKFCLTPFTRHVRAMHEVPRFGLDPFGWLAAAERIADERKADLLFPTQEQVTVLSARRKYLRVATIVPPFASLARVQDKISAFRALKAIGAPQP